MKLEDKVVVVTGAGSGIGRATALAVAKAGARVAACDIDPERLAGLARELGDRNVLVREVDVSDRGAMQAFADAVHERVPSADVVVNNAGVAVGGLFLDTTLDDWDWLLGINLRGVIHGCHYFLPKMVARKAGGQIVNISSILGIYPAPNVTAYVASKFAVLGLSQSLRAELAEHGIGVTAICPGMISTEIVKDSRISAKLHARRQMVMDAFRKRGAPPEAVARTIVDAIRTNPAVRTVGRDAAVVHALTRFVPAITSKLGTTLSRRFGALD
jgi:NAD(P)-dependent dehydrogenase (short-subunit alcohol dehydrogenase family)